MRGHVLVIGSREEEKEEREEKEEEKEEEKNLQIAFRCIEAVPILSLDYWYNPGDSPGGCLEGVAQVGSPVGGNPWVLVSLG